MLGEAERKVEYDAYLVATAALHRKLSLGTILAAKEPSLELQAIPGLTHLLHTNIVHQTSMRDALAKAAGGAASQQAPSYDGDCTPGPVHALNDADDLGLPDDVASAAPSAAGAAAPAPAEAGVGEPKGGAPVPPPA